VTLRDRQAETAKKMIVAAALEAFLEDGYVGTTMDDIAERAAVARRTIYNQFGSKAALLIAAINDRVADPRRDHSSPTTTPYAPSTTHAR
jgi:TetR/AcrR family transcriptional regulator, mexJK operon transcriptional repressor